MERQKIKIFFAFIIILSVTSLASCSTSEEDCLPVTPKVNTHHLLEESLETFYTKFDSLNRIYDSHLYHNDEVSTHGVIDDITNGASKGIGIVGADWLGTTLGSQAGKWIGGVIGSSLGPGGTIIGVFVGGKVGGAICGGASSGIADAIWKSHQLKNSDNKFYLNIVLLLENFLMKLQIL